MIEKLYSKVYNRRSYNCFHFTADVWLELTGDDIFIDVLQQEDYLRVLFSSFYQLDKPVAPCVIIYNKGRELHIGVYIEGRVLHINEAGVVLQPVDTLGAAKVRFYGKKHSSCIRQPA